MSFTPQSAPSRLHVQGDRMESSGRVADIVYQTVTIAAMLLLLGSLWVF
jgi:hypothetical protein